LSRSCSSRRWLDRQHHDIYTAKAKTEGYRSRAVYKLLEVQSKDKLLREGMTVIDLGAAPGGWSEVTSKIVGKRGLVIALDILPIEPLKDVDIIEGDFREQAVFDQLMAHLKSKEIHKVDLVISDMAPNISGVPSIDQPRSFQLADLALELSDAVLKKGGNLFIKVFQGEGFEAYWAMLKKRFQSVSTRKPQASRAESREIYVLAKGFLGVDQIPS
jgi:23S rRNA (uridine2552-2'-O)-methyltransferase